MAVGPGARPRGWRLVAALGGGALCALALPPFGLWPLGPLGGAALYVALGGAGRLARVAYGLAFGVGQFAIGLWFIEQFSAVGYVVLLVLESAFFALGALLVPRIGRGRVGAFGAALTLGEWARDHVPFGGLPPGGMALGQAGGPAAALARLGGPFLIVAAVGTAGAGIGALAAGRGDLGRKGATGVLLVIAAIVALSGALPAGGTARTTLVVAAVQGGGARGTSEIEVPSVVAFSATLGETASVRRPVALVIWPEDTVPLGQGAIGSSVAGLVRKEARRLRATLVVGATQLVGQLAFRNESLAFGPTGGLVAAVEKAHAVPFGEYVPWRGVLSHFVNLSAVPRDAIVGRGDGEMDTPAGRLAILISYEAFYTVRARSGVRAGGDLVVVETNTASYASSQVPSQELAASRLDAIATGRDLVQAATVGYSAVIDPEGRVLREVPLGGRGVIEQAVALRDGSTVYDVTGDWPTLALCGVLLALGLALARREASGGAFRRRRARPQPAPVAVPQPAGGGRTGSG